MSRSWFRSVLLAGLPRAARSRSNPTVEVFTAPSARRKTRPLSFETFEARRLLAMDSALGFDDSAPLTSSRLMSSSLTSMSTVSDSKMTSQRILPEEMSSAETGLEESGPVFLPPPPRRLRDDTSPSDNSDPPASPTVGLEVTDIIFQRPAVDVYESAILAVTVTLAGGNRSSGNLLTVSADVNFDGRIDNWKHSSEYEELTDSGIDGRYSYHFFVPDDGPSPGNGTPTDKLTIRAAYGNVVATKELTIKNLPPRFIAQPTFFVGKDTAGNSVARVTVQLADIGLVEVHTASVKWSDGIVTATQNFATIDNSCGPVRGRYATVERKLEPGQYVYPVEVRIADDDHAATADDAQLPSVKMSRLDLPLNDDDDDQSDKPDLAESRVSGEDDLRELDLTPLLSPQMTVSGGKFYFGYNVNRLRVWDSADKQRLILPYSIEQLGQTGIAFENISTIPYSGQKTVFVEGIADGQSSITLSWLSNIPYPIVHYPGCNPPIAPTPGGSVAVTVWSIDVDTDSDNTGVVDESYTEDLIEMSAPGNLLLLNADDDNENGIKDFEDDYTTGSGIDDDFDELILKYTAVPSSGNGYTIELGTEQSTVIAIWANGIKRPLDKNSFDLGVDWVPVPIFIEGIATGTATVTWSLKDPSGKTLVTDSVLFTVISGDLRAHRQSTPNFQDYVIPQALEDSQTIGIRRNGDDDDHDAIPDGFQRRVDNEDDTMKLEAVTLGGGPGVEWVISRSNDSVQIWSDDEKWKVILGSTAVFGERSGANTTNSAVIPGDTTLWIEWPLAFQGGKSTISLYARAANTHNGHVVVDSVTYEPFNSVTVVWMGELHEPADPPIHTDGSTMGMMQWAIDQYRQGFDVYAFGEADYFEPIVAPAYTEIKNAINNRGVTDVALIGYSHGGGTVWIAADYLTNYGAPEIKKPFEIVFTGFIDAISQSGRWSVFFPGSIGSVNTRPPGSLYHVSQFQKNTSLTGLYLNGDFSGGDVDIDRSGLGVKHSTIDDSEIVRDLLEWLYRKKVSK